MEPGVVVVWTDLALSQSLERPIAHDERDARFWIRGAFVDFGFVLYVDCPGCFEPFLVLNLKLEDRICLERYRTPAGVSTIE